MKDLFAKTDLVKKLKQVKLLKQVDAWFYSFDKEVQEYVIEYLIQKHQLIDLGVNAKGNVIGRYSQLTEQINPTKRAGSHYTLFDTGEFFNSMFIKVMNDGFIVDADADKTNFLGTTNLFEQYGNDIVGLTEESMTALKNEIKIRMIKYARKTLSID